MKNPSENIRKRRPDLSPYLFHFTGSDAPVDRMMNILSERCLKSNELEYVCFTESPLSHSIEQFNYMYSFYPWREPMYSKFGIGFDRDMLIREYKARPVIYGDLKEYNLLDDSLRWRFEKLDIDEHDYTWLREWRIKGNNFDFSKVSSDDIIVIAPTKKDLAQLVLGNELEDLDFDFEDGICYPYPIYRLAKLWKCITIEEANSYPNDYKVKEIVDKQQL